MMLSIENPPERDFREEDSSGSDAGSEVSLEPETDRFGFIVTNGSTACVSGVVPQPQLVRQREAKWISILDQWEAIMSKKTNKVKVQCQKGIPASLRAKCWPILCGASNRMKESKHLYESLNSQPALPNWVDVIERDLDRQFPFHEMFLSKDGHGQRGLFRVLKAYTQYQPEEGYCQAQGPVAAVLLMNMPAEEAFWCLVQISEQYLPGYYNPLLEGVLFDAAILTWVLKRTCPSAHKHLQHHGVEPLMFATDWLMCLFTRNLPFNMLLRVWDLFFCYGVKVLLQVAVVLVRRVLGKAEQRKQCQGQMEILERLRCVRDEVHEEDDAFITEVCSVPLSARDLERQAEKMLEKWRKERPSSTFDPRGRCQGYRMAWVTTQHNKEEMDRKLREKGNLSLPLARSASTLSLSPSLLRNRWRTGGKPDVKEKDGRRKVMRHLSMVAKESWRSCNNLQEDIVLEEHTKQEEPKLSGPNEKKGTEGGKKIIKQQLMVGKSEKTEKEHNSALTELTQSPTEGLCVEDPPLPVEHTPPLEQVPQDSRGQIPEMNPLETEEKDSKEATENQETVKIHAVEKNQTGILTDADTDTCICAKVEMNVSVDTSDTINVQKSEERGKENVEEKYTEEETTEIIEAEMRPDVTRHTIETDTKQPQPDVVIKTDLDSQGGGCDARYQCSVSITEAEPCLQKETETDVLEENLEIDTAVTLGKLAVNEYTIVTETETAILPSSEYTQQEQRTDETTPGEVETKTCISEVGKDKTENVDTIVAEQSAAQVDNNNICGGTHAGKRSTETTKCTAPLKEAQSEAKNDDYGIYDDTHPGESPSEPKNSMALKEDVTSQPESAKKTLAETKNIEQQTVQQMTKASIGPKEEKGVTINQDQAVRENIKTTSDQLVKNHTEQRKVGFIEASNASSSHSSGDVCERKTSDSRGSRAALELSEDLFTSPDKSNQSSTNQPDHSKNTEPQLNSDTPSTTAEIPPSNQELRSPGQPKHRSLFHRLKGEQSAKSKQKETPKMKIPKILIQDFSDRTEIEKPLKEEREEKLSKKELRRKQREQEIKRKEEAKSRKKREREQESEKRRKPQTRGKSFQVQRENKSENACQPANTSSDRIRCSDFYAESYF